jgi:hypothetical protein
MDWDVTEMPFYQLHLWCLTRYVCNLDTMTTLTRQALYASGILLVVVFASAKASLVYLIIGLHPPVDVLWMCRGILVTLVTWATISILVTAFQCDLPRPWDQGGHCINRYGLDMFNCIANILTDLALVAVPVYLMMKVQVTNSKRVLVVSLFGSRLM